MHKESYGESIEFLGSKIVYSENVLTPRLETEVLVLGLAKRLSTEGIQGIFDIWTGSGAIALAMARYFPESKIFWVDISSAALRVAELNAKLNLVDITFLEGDLLGPVMGLEFSKIGSKLLFVANLPYIWANEEIGEDVITGDPALALYGWWELGFDLIQCFLEQVHTKFGSEMDIKVALEFWHTQLELLTEWCDTNQVSMESWADYSGIKRFALLNFSWTRSTRSVSCNSETNT